MQYDIMITQPMKLERLAILKLNRWIISQAETLIHLHARNPAAADEILPKQIDSTQNYIEHNLPRAYYDELFKEVLESLIDLFSRTRWADHNGRWDALGRMIETVLSENLTVLSLYYSWEIFEGIFESNCGKLTGLQYLDLPSDVREQVIIKLLEKAHGLRHLKIETIKVSTIITANILRCMVQNCKLVEELFFGDFFVTEDDVNILTELRNLRCVHLRGASAVSEMAIEKLLMSCENLERLEIYVFRDILKIIERVSKIKESSGKQLKLKSYHNGNGRMRKQMQISFRNCQFIQELGLHKNYREHVGGDLISLEPVKELQHLRKLSIGRFDFYTDRVNEVLKAKGRDLIDLYLWKVTEMDLHSLKYISVMCPRLQNYQIVCCSFARETLMEENEVEISPLKYVESFNLRFWNNASTPMEHLHFLLTNHLRVEVLEVGKTKMLQDVIMAVLDKNPESLMYLRYFETNERLSMLAIDRIVQNCIYPVVVKANLLT